MTLHVEYLKGEKCTNFGFILHFIAFKRYEIAVWQLALYLIPKHSENLSPYLNASKYTLSIKYIAFVILRIFIRIKKFIERILWAILKNSFSYLQSQSPLRIWSLWKSLIPLMKCLLKQFQHKCIHCISRFYTIGSQLSRQKFWKICIFLC